MRANFDTIGLRIDAFLHHGDAQRHVDRAGSAGRTGDDAAFDADLHGHDAGRDAAFARGADDRALIAQVERRRLAARSACCRSSASRRRRALRRPGIRHRHSASAAPPPASPVVALDRGAEQYSATMCRTRSGASRSRPEQRQSVQTLTSAARRNSLLVPSTRAFSDSRIFTQFLSIVKPMPGRPL